MKLKKLLHHSTKVEKILLVFFGLVLIVSAYQLASAFYAENSEMDYIPGGVYIEGAVGQVGVLNPLFVQHGSIAHDLTQLIFSGLTKYDSETGEIVGDLANIKADPDGKEYTFVIKEGAKWHDGETVTASDVLFTYNDVIKNPEFSGNILNYNDYSGIKVNKIDERTVEFLLEKPDSFFLVKTMTGILPKHLLKNEPVNFLETAPYNFAPVGSGRYKFVSQVQLADHSEYGLEAFEDFYDGPPNIESILFKAYGTYEDLQKNLSGLSGIRSIPADNTEAILKKGRFTLDRYQLPQYVAIFINNEADKLKDAKVRLALQLGTDKQSLIEAINQQKVIDTPLLEINQENWVHQYSVSKANGSLFETRWQIPNKDEVIEEEVEEEEEVSPTAEVTYINSPNEGKDWETTREPITITGTVPKNTKSIIIDDYELQKYVPGDPGWSYVAATKFDSLKPGENIYEVYAVDFNGEKKLIDSIKITFGSATALNDEELEKMKEENEEAELLPTRENKSGEKLSLKLITSSKPEIYRQVALEVKKQWQKIGVEIVVEVLDNGVFQERLNSRDYDLLIFGQNLGYNLDAYPYWHSSQAKEGGLNLSQFKDFVVDSLLEKARLEDEEVRKETLNDIQEIISQEVPAIFLYSPTYYTALAEEVYHPPFNHLATISDRLGSIEDWYAKADRAFKKGSSPLTFFPWIIKQF
jgi:ABC-type transport system substrate-binding protein